MNEPTSSAEFTKALGVKPNAPRIPVAQRRKARRLIVQALYQRLLSDTSPREIEEQFREEHTGKVDWEYFSEIFVGIIEQRAELDAHIAPFLDREASALDPIEQAVLYLGCYEFANRIDVPYRVVINECVDLAKVFGATDGHKYINGVLDKMALTLRPLETQRRG
jgi:N utilization substance protein B